MRTCTVQVVCSIIEPEADGRCWHMDSLAELLLDTIKGVTPLYDSMVRVVLVFVFLLLLIWTAWLSCCRALIKGMTPL